jgi:8-oxo-dGTP pyrophosphatase MutT (NUDIX family)
VNIGPRLGCVTDPTASFATPRVAAGALFLDGQGRVLLVHPTYKATWDIPGGYVERGESPAAACRRELKEELGIDREPLRMISVDWAPNDREGDKLLFLFDCGKLGADEAQIRLPVDELDRWEWVDLEQLNNYVIDRITQRVRAAVLTPSVAYLEHGRPAPAASSP